MLRRTLPPIPVGALVSYRRHGRLRGGPDQPDEGRVVRLRYVRTEKQWRFYLSNGLYLTSDQVVAVTLLCPPGGDSPARVPDRTDLQPCFLCRGSSFWHSFQGPGPICVQCHPPVGPEVVAKYEEVPTVPADAED
jgi:hypothetical protein